MMNRHLLMDAGNTALKFCFADQLIENRVKSRAHGSYDIEHELNELNNHQSLSRVSLASVYETAFAEAVKKWCLDNNVPFLQASAEKKSGTLVSGYRQPAQLGVDRWLSMLALWEKYRQAFFVVSCGTAVTYDAVDETGQHLGGVIIPGPDLMKQSLIENTASINDANGLISDNEILADNTRDAITRGTLTAVKALIIEIVSATGFAAGQGYLTGGCAGRISGLLPQKLTVAPDLVLSGLKIYAERPAR